VTISAVESYIKITPMPQGIVFIRFKWPALIEAAGKFVWQTARTVHFKPEFPFLPFATNYFVTVEVVA
jgi:hypothetical protein